MTALDDAKRAARRVAESRRNAAADPAAGRMAAGFLRDALHGWTAPGQVIAGFLPIRSEIDPRTAMVALHEAGRRVAVPVVRAPRRPLGFRRWHPGAVLVPGPFGVDVPEQGGWVLPHVLIVPLLAFDATGRRLGYGGGFYDRTLARLRHSREVLAVGFAYGAQECPEVPADGRDARLDAVVTEAGLRCFGSVRAPVAAPVPGKPL